MNFIGKTKKLTSKITRNNNNYRVDDYHVFSFWAKALFLFLNNTIYNIPILINFYREFNSDK